LNPAPAAINFSKLDHFNGLHIRSLALGDLSQRLYPYFEMAGLRVDPVILEKITPLVQPRITTLDDAVDIAGFFFRERVEPRVEELIGKDLSPQESAEIARKSYVVLEHVEAFSAENAETAMRQLVEELGLTAGQVFGILRVAITGQKISPPLFESMEIIGKQKTLERISYAVKLLEGLGEMGS